VKAQDLAGRQAVIEVRRLLDDADESLDGDGLAPDVVRTDERSPAGRPYARRQRANRRRLACAVGTEQPEDLSGVDLQRQAIEREDVGCRGTTFQGRPCCKRLSAARTSWCL
jgi:hypothetical protein